MSAMWRGVFMLVALSALSQPAATEAAPTPPLASSVPPRSSPGIIRNLLTLHPATNTQHVIEGTILRVSPLPDPKTSEYKDCLFSITVEVHSTLTHAPLSKHVVLIMPGFLDRELCMKTPYRPGAKIRPRIISYDELPDTLKQLQLVDHNEDLDLPYFFCLDVTSITAFTEPAATAAAVPSKRNLALPSSAPPDAIARDHRRETIRLDLQRINALLAKHGNDWDAWHRSLAPARAEYSRARRDGAHRWIADSYFAASRAQLGSVYSNAFVTSLIAFNRYLAKRSIDLIAVRVPYPGEISADLFCRLPDDNVLNPYILRMHKELLEADVEIVANIADAAIARRMTYPLMFWYQDEMETHPAEGMSWAISSELATRLQRYRFTSRVTSNAFMLHRRGGYDAAYRSFHWPVGNIKYPATDYVNYNSVVSPDRIPLTLRRSSESPVLVCGSSFIAYPNMGRSASVPHYLSYLTGIIPNVLYRSGSDLSVPRAIHLEKPSFLTNRTVCVFVFRPSTCNHPLLLPHVINPLDESRTLLCEYSGRHFRESCSFPDAQGPKILVFSHDHLLYAYPTNNTRGASGVFTVQLPADVRHFQHIILEFVFDSKDWAMIECLYGDDIDVIRRSTSSSVMSEFCVLTPGDSLSTSLRVYFKDFITRSKPTILRSIRVYGLNARD